MSCKSQGEEIETSWFSSDMLLRKSSEKHRVATAQGKQRIWKSVFPDRENTGNFLKNIKNMFLHREFTTNTGKILKVKKIMNLLSNWMEWPSGCIVPGSWSVNFWLLFCKLLRGLLNWIYSGHCGSPGRERMAMGEVEAIYKLNFFFFLSRKKHRENGKSTGKTQGI